MGQDKQLNINKTYYFFDDMIDIKRFSVERIKNRQKVL